MKIQPPTAKIIPKKIKKHHDIRIDNYYWLNDRENPEVIDYLNDENNYYQEMTAHTKDFQEELFLEMKARIKEDDESVPYFYNGYFYITRFEKGQDYPIYSRKKLSLSADEEILFDCNILAKDKAFFNLGGLIISPNNKFAIFSCDFVGRRIYSVQIKNLETNEILPDLIENVTGTAVWANDNQTIFYSSQDETTLRADKIFKHKLGQQQQENELIYFEKDETFTVDIAKSKSNKYLAIESGSTLTTEYQILEADNPDGEFRIFQKRVRGIEYSINHYQDSFYILTNKDGAENFKLMKTNENKTSQKYWTEIIAHRTDVLLEDIEIFNDFFVLEERENGLTKIRIIPNNNEPEYYLPFDSETYSAYCGTNADFHTDILRYGYQSLATPSSVIDFNMKTKTKEIKKEQQVYENDYVVKYPNNTFEVYTEEEFNNRFSDVE